MRFLSNSSYGPTPLSRRDAFWKAGFWRDAGAFIGVHLLFILACWLVVNLFLWRGTGMPSSSRDRVVPALLMAIFSASLGWWCWLQAEVFLSSSWTRAQQQFSEAVVSVVTPSFVGAPFLLAISVAAATMWRHKEPFLRPARIETELRLSRFHATLLKSGPTLFCAASLFATALIWVWWLGLIAFGVTTLDPLGYSPDDGRATTWRTTIPTEALIGVLFYSLALNFLGFLLWFAKWRYYSAPATRQIAQNGLRHWKEALGLYLVMGSAIYLGAALIGWPQRAAAARELEIRMVQGELPR